MEESVTDIQVHQERQVYSVSQLTRHIRYTLEDQFSSVWVEGEISGFTHHSSGHMYFTIKDNESSLQCVMFRRDNVRLKFKPEGGLKVICHGRVSVYVPRGQYQLTVDSMEPKGLGDLQLAFEQLKRKLSEEGLFDEERKKSIPFLPQKIGVITSLTGAVIHDVKRILDRRFPDYQLLICPVQVQGESAKTEIAHAIQMMNEYKDVDVVILARGGGSIEDLWAFNEEVVARAIDESKIPVISAVGHEVDYTIADFVADMRAPTPSAAAELILPEKQALLNEIKDSNERLEASIWNCFRLLKERLEYIQSHSIFENPMRLLDDARQHLDRVNEDLMDSLKHRVQASHHEFSLLVNKLDALSPLACLSRGYSIAFDETKAKVIKSTNHLTLDDRVRVQLSDGEFVSRVTEINPRAKSAKKR